RSGSSVLVLAGSPPDPIFRFLARVSAIDAAGAPPLPKPRGATLSVIPDAAPAGERAREAS
nr:hypothetical protein [Myxococcota bacterium]